MSIVGDKLREVLLIKGGLTHDGEDTHVLVEEIDTCVSTGVEHLIESENVILSAVLLQVVVLHRGDTKDLSSLLKLALINLHLLAHTLLYVLLLDTLTETSHCAVLCLIKKVHKLGSITLTGLHLSDLRFLGLFACSSLLFFSLLLFSLLFLWFACLNLCWCFLSGCGGGCSTLLWCFLINGLGFWLGLSGLSFLTSHNLEHQAKSDMVISGLGGVHVANLLGSINDSIEVKLLSLVSHIHYPCSLLVISPVSDSRKISGVIAVATVSLLNHEGNLALGHEYALGAVGFSQEPTCGEVLKHGLDQGVVEGLATVGDADLEAVVDTLELFL